MQPAATTAEPKKKTSKWLKGTLYCAFAFVVAGHLISDYARKEVSEAQETIITLKDRQLELKEQRIESLQEQVELLKQGLDDGGTCAYDDGFIIPDLKRQTPIQVKASKPASAVASRTI
jgi:hypothetical protein